MRRTVALILLRARNRGHYVGGSDNVLRARYVRVTSAHVAPYAYGALRARNRLLGLLLLLFF